jgi:hypothetical protein
MLLTGVTAPVVADPPGRQHDRDDRREHRDERKGRDDRRDRDKRKVRDNRSDRDQRHERDEHRDGDDRRNRDVRRDRDFRFDRGRRTEWGRNAPDFEPRWERPEYRYRERFRDYRKPPVIIHRGKPRVVPRDRYRWHRDVVVVRPYGHWYSGYGHYRRDDDAYKWLAFTAITLGLLDYLNEVQQREHEAAQISAATAPLGERIIWQEGGASGYVVATREGTTPSGRYCREFQHQVSIGGRVEQAYGTACRNPDGSWEVVSVDDY